MNKLAFDLGASSGRALAGRLKGGKMEVEEIHRFPNRPISMGGVLQWDFHGLLGEIKRGLLKAKSVGEFPDSIAIDSWAVDYGLMRNGHLMGNPYHYRDRRTEGVMERVTARLSKEYLFQRTGIQFLPFNTVYQLAAMQEQDPDLLQVAERFFMIPDLIRYFLTGERLNEFTNATTTQLLNVSTQLWDGEILSKIGVDESLFGRIVPPGTYAGRLLDSVCDELGVPSTPVIAVGEHDTASAVAAVPAMDSSFAYLSCGTWSLLGTEVERPVISRMAMEMNFTNEGGAGGKYRLLKNIMGLWILQELKREWEREGKDYSFTELVRMAERSPAFTSFINPDAPLFLHAGDMSVRIREYCTRTGQKIPEKPEELIRCVLESLALQYRHVYMQTEMVSGSKFQGLHMVGGGIQNELLCQWTANAIGNPVWAGPAEASAIGNLAVQWIAAGEFKDLGEARTIIRNSFEIREYEPVNHDAWEEAYGIFKATSLG